MNILEIEASFIGCLLLDNSLIEKYEWVTDEYFAHDDFKIIYKAIKATNNESTDIVLVAQELKKQNQLDRLGGPEYLIELKEECPNPLHIKKYASLMNRDFQRRKLLELAKSINIYIKENTEPEQIINQTEKEIFNLMSMTGKSEEEYKIENIIKQNEGMSEEPPMAQVRFKRLNKYLTGNRQGAGSPRPGHIWVIGGYTKTGKTMFTLQLIHDFALQGKSTKFYSYEMEETELVSRIEHINNNTKNKINLKEASISLMAPYNNSISFVKGDILSNDYDFYVIDYLGLLSEKGMTKQQILEEGAMIFKNLARKKQCCIIILSQINRESAKSESQNVMGFMGSSNIEAACDLGIVLKRDFDKESLASSNWVEAYCHIPKFRHGPKGSILLSYNIETGLYHNPSDIAESEDIF